MGQLHRFLGLTVGVDRPRRLDRPTRSALQYDCDITYGTNNEFGFDYLRDNMVDEHRRAGAARQPQPVAGRRTTSRSSTRSTRSSSTRRARRSSSRAGPPTRPSSTTSSPASCAACSASATTRSTRRSAPSSPPKRASRASSRRSASTNLYENVNQNYVHQIQQALRAKELFKRDVDYIVARRRGEDRRRVHRPHPRGPPLERRSAPGRRGQGGRAHQGGEPDARHGHAAELLPHVRQARRA